MLSNRTRSIAGLLLAALLVPAVVLPLRELPILPSGPDPPGAPSSLPGNRAAVSPLNLSVDLSPGTWTMSPGDSVNLTATFVGVPTGCQLGFDWYAWTLAGLSFNEGFLNSSSGANVRATAEPNARQPLEISVTGTAELDCPGYTSYVQDPGFALIELLPRLAIPSVTLTPNPVLPGDLVAVHWNFSGGVGPYAVVVDFGDGTNTSVPQDDPGAGVAFHRFPPGEFAPQVEVTDSRGARAESSIAQPLVSDSGLSVTITPAAPGPEVGRPFEDNGTIAGGTGWIAYTWSVNGTPLATGQSPELPSLRFTPRVAGPIAVELAAVDAARENGSAEQNLTVAPDVAFSISALHPGGDVGRPLLLNLTISGGIAPYSLAWTCPPGGTPGTATLSAMGTQYLAIVPATPGPVVLDATLTDAVGGIASGTFELGDVGVGPSASLTAPPQTVEAGQPLDLGLQIVGGSGPFAWSIEPSEGVGESTADSGVVPTGAPVNWSGIPTTSSDLEVTALVVDAYGGFAETNRTIAVLPALGLAVAVSNATFNGATTVTVFANLGGGVPPYTLHASVGGRTESLSNLSSPGGYTLRFTAPPTGFDDVRVDVVDTAGINDSRSATIFVDPTVLGAAPPPNSAGPSSEASSGTIGTAAAGLLLVTAVAGGFWYLRRRNAGGARPGSPSTAGRALALVRRTLSSGEGLDPETLAMIGEEEGLDAASIEAAVRQWDRLGRIRRETEPSGGELVHWNPANAPSSPGIPDGGEP